MAAYHGQKFTASTAFIAVICSLLILPMFCTLYSQARKVSQLQLLKACVDHSRAHPEGYMGHVRCNVLFDQVSLGARKACITVTLFCLF